MAEQVVAGAGATAGQRSSKESKAASSAAASCCCGSIAIQVSKSSSSTEEAARAQLAEIEQQSDRMSTGQQHGPAAQQQQELQQQKSVVEGLPGRRRWQLLHGFGAHACAYTKASSAFLASHPWAVAASVAVLVLCLIAGVIGILAITNMVVEQRKSDAAGDAADGMKLLLSTMELAGQYAYGFAYVVRHTPGFDYVRIKQEFNETADRKLAMLEGAGNDLADSISFGIGPAGIISHIYPLRHHANYIGVNIFADEKQRASSLAAVNSGGLFMSGPLRNSEGRFDAFIRVPIFVNGSLYRPNETFGAPNNALPTHCPECFGERRFWGFVSSLVDWEALLAVSHIDDMQKGVNRYTYRLVRPMEGNEHGDSGEFMLAQSQDLADGQPFPSDGVKVQFKVLTSNWTLYVHPCGGWYPLWRWPLLVTVVVISVLLSALVALILLRNGQLKAAMDSLGSEKQRLDTLVVRQYELINCMRETHGPSSKRSGEESSDVGASVSDPMLTLSSAAAPGARHRASRGSSPQDKIAALRRSLLKSGAAQLAELEKIEIQDLLGHGSFGKVYRGLWRGTIVAVKCLVMPAAMSSNERAEKMAVMEAAVSSSMCHPHLVQTYTYSIKSMRDEMQSEARHSDCGMGVPALYRTDRDSALRISNNNNNIHGYEVRLVLEFCDKGSLREALDQEAFIDGLGLNYGAVLDTAADIARGMLHLHLNQILHSDLKASNVMLKSGSGDGRGLMAKVMDFGLAVKLETVEQTHVSSLFQGTPTHMAPEVMLEGKQSKAADVYAFGITLYELFSGGRPYHGVAKALLGHLIAHERRRPEFTLVTPSDYRDLAERCWHHDPDMRPTFHQILEQLQAMRARLGTPSRALKLVVNPPTKPATAASNGGAQPATRPSSSLSGNGQQARPLPGIQLGQRTGHSHEGDGGGDAVLSMGSLGTYGPPMETIVESDGSDEPAGKDGDGGGGGGGGGRRLSAPPQYGSSAAGAAGSGLSMPGLPRLPFEPGCNACEPKSLVHNLKMRNAAYLPSSPHAAGSSHVSSLQQVIVIGDPNESFEYGL